MLCGKDQPGLPFLQAFPSFALWIVTCRKTWIVWIARYDRTSLSRFSIHPRFSTASFCIAPRTHESGGEKGKAGMARYGFSQKRRISPLNTAFHRHRHMFGMLRTKDDFPKNLVCARAPR